MIYLASQSPRRAELLRLAEIEFQQFAVDIDESSLPSEDPLTYLKRVVMAKFASALESKKTCEVPILVADTIVVINNEILQKPADYAVFCDYMQKLSGNWHQVITGFALGVKKAIHYEYQVTEVLFACLSNDEIASYWQTNEPQDKAGGYAIQGIGQQFVTEIKGDFDNVVGLPVTRVRSALANLGYSFTK